MHSRGSLHFLGIFEIQFILKINILHWTNVIPKGILINGYFHVSSLQSEQIETSDAYSENQNSTSVSHPNIAYKSHVATGPPPAVCLNAFNERIISARAWEQISHWLTPSS